MRQLHAPQGPAAWDAAPPSTHAHLHFSADVVAGLGQNVALNLDHHWRACALVVVFDGGRIRRGGRLGGGGVSSAMAAVDDSDLVKDYACGFLHPLHVIIRMQTLSVEPPFLLGEDTVSLGASARVGGQEPRP